jgi:hypothetical protein
VLDGLGAEEQQQEPADDLQGAVEALEHQPDLEGLVQRRRQGLRRSIRVCRRFGWSISVRQRLSRSIRG